MGVGEWGKKWEGMSGYVGGRSEGCTCEREEWESRSESRKELLSGRVSIIKREEWEGRVQSVIYECDLSLSLSLCVCVCVCMCVHACAQHV